VQQKDISSMTSIDNIILKSTNPFDNFRSVNFWHKQKDSEPVVESIHQDAIATIEETLDQVAEDHRTRTIRLEGDPGSGKTYLLGRLKRTLNSKAFFAYINPFPQSDQIWRHILRYTVDSLVQVPEGQQDSQLMLWLKSLSVFTKRSLKQRIFKDDFWKSFTSDRKKFIQHLKDTYKQEGIYNADNFLGVLHDLTNPELYPLACDWLRGDSLSEDSLKTLRVGDYIDSEKAAYETLLNFSRISTETQPIVLCFDQLESIARLPDGFPDLQTLFSVHTKIHDENSNLLIIISSPTDTWMQNKGRIDQSHKDRIDQTVSLKSIPLKAAESILASRLYSLHRQANPQPPSPLYPITQQHLEDVFPGGKTNPRNALRLGLNVFQKYKKWLIGGGEGSFVFSHREESPENEHSELLANFKLRWSEELAKVQQRITKIRQLSSSELIQMLQESLAALQAEKIKVPLLTGTKFASYSLSYQMPGKPERIGVVWTEDQNMGTFFRVMEACRKAVEQNLCQTLYLIREEGLGKPNNKGYKLYTQIFTGSPHTRITPDIVSVHYLATYYDLVKDAREGDLVVRGEPLGLKKLQNIIPESKVLHDCPSLQELGIVPVSRRRKDQDLKPVKDFLLNLVITQQILGRPTLLENAGIQFPKVDESKINKLIDQLCQENKIQILDPRAKPKSQLVCLIPKAS
jgi:Cdc6-like AAA superfamily ATPase